MTPAERPERVVAPLLLACTVVVTAVRWWTSRRRVVFHMNPDEPGQLAMARFIGGGTRWNMFDHSTWRPGYATLISPITWFTDDPVLSFRVALGVNAVLGGLSCALLFLLARRLTTLSAAWCAVAAISVALAPTVVFTTNWVWSEALVQVTYLGCVLAALRFLDRPSLGWGGAMIALAATGFAAHSRLLPLSIAVLGAVVVALVRRRLAFGRGAGLIVIMAALDVGVSRYSHWIVGRVWDAPRATNTAEGVAARLGNVTDIAASTLGQVWYQLVATVGVAGLGTLALVRAARRGGERPSTDDARFVVGTVALLVGLSIVFMADRWRPDQLVYGRYNDVAMAPVVLVGVGALVSARRARLWRDMGIVVVVTLVSAVGLRVWRDEDLRAAGMVRSMILGLIGYLGTASDIRIVGVTVVATVVMIGVVLLAVAARGRAREAIVLATVVALLAGGYARTRPVIDRGRNGWDIATAVHGVTEVLPAGVVVRERMVPDSRDPAATWAQQRLRSMLYQFYLPDNPLVGDGDPRPEPWTPYVFAPLGDPGLVAAGAVVLWRDRAVSIGLWEEPRPDGG